MKVLKLNLGCGSKHLDGYVNVDKFGEPDLHLDLETFPWPWKDSSVDEILLIHVLEHLGQDTEVYFKIVKELYRICKPNSIIKIIVPHPRHDNFISDPTHVRIITPSGLGLFSKKANLMFQEINSANTQLGLYLDVDFEIISANNILTSEWEIKLNSGEVSQEDVMYAANSFNNVIKEIHIEWKVLK